VCALRKLEADVPNGFPHNNNAYACVMAERRGSGQSHGRLLRTMHREISAFLGGQQLHQIIPGYVAPALREARLIEQLNAMRDLIGTEEPAVGSKRLRLMQSGGADHLSEDHTAASAKHLAELDSLQFKLDEAKLQLLRSDKAHADELAESQSTNAKLLRQVKFLAGEEEAAVNELKKKQTRWHEEREDLEAHVRASDEKVHSLERQLQDALRSNTKLRKAEQELTRIRTADQMHQKTSAELQRTRQALEESRAAARASEQRAQEAEAALRKVTSTSSSNASSGGAVDSGISSDEQERRERALRTQIRELEKVLKRKELALQVLEADRVNSIKAEQEKASLKDKVLRLEQALSQSHTAAAKYESLLQDTEDWHTMFAKLLQSSGMPSNDIQATPREAMKLLQRAQSDHAAAVNRASASESEVHVLQRQLRDTQQQLAHEQTLHAQTKADLSLKDSQLQFELRTKETRAREVASMRELMLTYQQDSGRVSVNAEGSAAATAALEAALTAANSELTELRSHVSSSYGQSATAVKQLQTELRAVEKERDTTLKQLETVEKALSTYERQAAVGDYDKGTTKVLHFVENPAAVAAAKRSRDEKDMLIVALRKDKENLQEQVTILMAGAGEAERTAAANAAAAQAEGYDKDTRYERLKQVLPPLFL
jgi:chromosome segregation ATPase